MRNRKLVVAGILLAMSFFAGGGSPQLVRQALNEVTALCCSNKWDYWTMEESMNFEWFREKSAYRSFSAIVSNDWATTLSSMSVIATNNLERLFVLGVGKQYGEDFYIDYMGALADMATNSLITTRELEWAKATTRYDLMSCLYRRYREPKVIELVNKYKVVFPQRTNRWDAILSGAAYTNYLEEVAVGLWQ